MAQTTASTNQPAAFITASEPTGRSESSEKRNYASIRRMAADSLLGAGVRAIQERRKGRSLAPIVAGRGLLVGRPRRGGPVAPALTATVWPTTIRGRYAGRSTRLLADCRKGQGRRGKGDQVLDGDFPGEEA